MTCEVAVMNKRGIALAADSAVTLGEGKKIYHTAEKLFSLSPSVPVAIMTYWMANMMSVPWETVVKIYAQKLGNRRFDTLDQYANDFLGFIEGATTLFPAEDQKRSVQGVVGAVWSGLYRDKLHKKMIGAKKKFAGNAIAVLSDIIRRDHEIWEKYANLEGVDGKYGVNVVEAYAEAINQVETKVFEGLKLTDQVRRDLRKTVAFMFGKKWFHPEDESGIVIAGMGDVEAFPALIEYTVGTIAAGKLRYVKKGDARVGAGSDAWIVPFAQDQVINMIINGIHPGLYKMLVDDVERWIPDVSKIGKGTSKTSVATAKKIDKHKEKFEKYLRTEIAKSYDQPLMHAVSGLPRQDLAKMAEALVNLTVFRMRMDVEQKETVAEPIDVAILSKGDGFIWVRHKSLT